MGKRRSGADATIPRPASATASAAAIAPRAAAVLRATTGAAAVPRAIAGVAPASVPAPATVPTDAETAAEQAAEESSTEGPPKKKNKTKWNATKRKGARSDKARWERIGILLEQIDIPLSLPHNHTYDCADLAQKNPFFRIALALQMRKLWAPFVDKPVVDWTEDEIRRCWPLELVIGKQEVTDSDTRFRNVWTIPYCKPGCNGSVRPEHAYARCKGEHGLVKNAAFLGRICLYLLSSEGLNEGNWQAAIGEHAGETSHRCHDRDCINPLHIVIESHGRNVRRKPCSLNAEHLDTCTHQPPCIDTGGSYAEHFDFFKTRLAQRNIVFGTTYDPTYVCPVCQTVFYDCGAMAAHLTNVHQPEWVPPKPTCITPAHCILRSAEWWLKWKDMGYPHEFVADIACACDERGRKGYPDRPCDGLRWEALARIEDYQDPKKRVRRRFKDFGEDATIG